jgi:hypothetical protein
MKMCWQNANHDAASLTGLPPTSHFVIPRPRLMEARRLCDSHPVRRLESKPTTSLPWRLFLRERSRLGPGVRTRVLLANPYTTCSLVRSEMISKLSTILAVLMRYVHTMFGVFFQRSIDPDSLSHVPKFRYEIMPVTVAFVLSTVQYRGIAVNLNSINTVNK